MFIFKGYYSILREFLSRIFTENFLIFSIKSFLFVLRQISNILHRQSRFSFLFRGFQLKKSNISIKLELNKFIYPTVLCFGMSPHWILSLNFLNKQFQLRSQFLQFTSNPVSVLMSTSFKITE